MNIYIESTTIPIWNPNSNLNIRFCVDTLFVLTFIPLGKFVTIVSFVAIAIRTIREAIETKN